MLIFYFYCMSFIFLLFFIFKRSFERHQGRIQIEISFSAAGHFQFYFDFLKVSFFQHHLISFSKGFPTSIISLLKFSVIFLKNSFSSHEFINCPIILIYIIFFFTFGIYQVSFAVPLICFLLTV